jgi:hypothetical protein
MNRKINMTYKLNEDLTLLTIDLIDESNNNITRYVREYNLIQYDEPMILYNQMLDDFNAEYDNELADTINRIVYKLEKESDKNE